MHLHRAETYKPSKKSSVNSFLAVNRCSSWYIIICGISIMVREEQCGLFSTLSFQGLCTDCLRARICCALHCFWHVLAQYVTVTLVIWFWLIVLLLVLFCCLLWLRKGGWTIPYMDGHSVAPLVGEQPRGYRIWCLSHPMSWSMIGCMCPGWGWLDECAQVLVLAVRVCVNLGQNCC